MADPLETRFHNLLADATDEQVEAMALRSPVIHFACFCQIHDKNNRLISPCPNILQLRLSEVYETLVEMGTRVRIIAVKPRRAGCTSFSSHILYHHGMVHSVEGIAISDVKNHSEELLEKLEGYSQND